jgi:sialate O-acetylesterase
MIRAGILVIMVCFLSGCQKTPSNLSLPSLIGKDMILQQKTDFRIWGKATPGHRIKIVASWDQEAKTKTGKDGKWSVTIPAPSAGGPYTMTISASDTVIFIDNILSGEVWFCSGQSNMEMPLAGWPPNDTIVNSARVIESALFPEIRLFNVQRKMSGEPVDDCTGKWEMCDPSTVEQFSATAYFFGKKLYDELHVPVGLIESAWGGTPAESWISATALEGAGEFIDQIKSLKGSAPLQHDHQVLFPYTPAVLYNAMVNPVVNYPIKGAIWYQGESNVGRAEQYRKIFPLMIRNWRDAWGIKDFPFYYVQIAPYVYSHVDSTESALLREAQEAALDLPCTGMAVTLDIATVMNIHPPFKKEIGERLAAFALNNDYGIKTPCEGPIYKSLAVEGSTIKILFDNVEGGLIAKNGRLREFEIAGADGKYVMASAGIVNNEVVVYSPLVKDPESVRYCWRNGAEASIFNSTGLPAWQFRTKK